MALLAAIARDIAELVRAGYPEETARRIATGKLDIRPEARFERQLDLYPTIAYHGTSDDILNVDVNRASTGKTRDTGFFMSENPVIASSYAGLPRGVGDNVLPLAVNTQGFDLVDAGSSDWNRIINPDFLIGGERLATVGDLPMSYSTRSPDTPLFDLDNIVEFDTDELARTSRRLGSPGIVIKDVADIGPNYRAMTAALQAQTGLKRGDEGYQQALDTLYGNTIVASDPSRVRSLYSAAFDPEYTGPNILGFQGGSQRPSLLDAAANSAVGAASVASDSPEEKLYEGLTDKMVDYLTDQMGGSKEDRQRAELISMGMDFLPFIGAAKGVSETFDAYKNDDALGMALGAAGTVAGLIPFGRSAFKGVLGMVEDAPQVTRDTALLQRVGDPESVNTMKLEVEPGVELLPSRRISAADLEDRGFVSGMADTSRGDLSRVVAVNDQPVDMVRFGGQDYMRQPYNAERGILWASDEGAITGLTNAAKAASEISGGRREPLYIPYQMGGASTDFATMTADIMVPIAKQNLNKTKKRALDKRIREGAGNKKNEFKPQPDWPGIDSPKAAEWLANAGGDRKAVTKAIDEFRDDAGINLSQARAAIVDAEQMTPRVGNLRQAGILDLTKAPEAGRHPSYNTDLMGTYLGQFGEGANVLDDLNPLIRSSRTPFVPEMISRGHDLSGATIPAPVGKAMQPGLIGMFDQATIDELIRKGVITP